ncbi:MAG TPA: hypothetical protein PKW55_00350 [Spirochaetota bacterium]|nr:hypothetical protein [Spirochaetota bacterium]HOM37808.1 hypothetical protein [Spirochaetota bacterium]HPQ49315.1 hypothetical protein [Spirochaetota bacterium]
MKKKIKAGNYIYYYYYDNLKRLVFINVCQGKIFKKKYGDYEFIWESNLLKAQVSKIEGLGITERIMYFYDSFNRLIKKEYYNKEILRYTVILSYKDNENIPYFMDIKRMSMEFFKTENTNCIMEMINIVGKDFEGSFYLLDLIDKYKQSS